MASVKQTSIESYYSIPNLGEMQQRAYDALATFGPGTDREIVKAAGYKDGNDYKPRRNELEKAGRIECTGKHRQDNGKMAYVYQVTKNPRRVLLK
jgi:hypothetical protein